MDSDVLTTLIDRSITDPLFDGSLSFSLPTDKMTEYSVTLTDENGIDLVFENIPISECTFILNNYSLFSQEHLTFKTLKYQNVVVVVVSV